MIDIALSIEKSHPLGITYHVADVKDLVATEKKFNFVTAFYLLNYAKTVEELEQMVQVIADQLETSSRSYFLAITLNVHEANNIVNSDKYAKYDFYCTGTTPLVDGAAITNTCLSSDGSSCSYTNYYLSPEHFERAFKKVGFKHFEWVPAAVRADSEEFADFYQFPDIIGIFAYK